MLSFFSLLVTTLICGTRAGKRFPKQKLIYLQTIIESGCDAVTTVRVEYKVDTSLTHSWKSVKPDKITTTYVTIDGLSYERYEVRLVVINNENITSTSVSKYVDFRISDYIISRIYVY